MPQGDRADGPGGLGRRRLLARAVAGAAGLAAGCSTSTPTPTPTSRPAEYPQRPIEVLHGWTGGDGARAIGSVERMFRARNPDVSLDVNPVGGTGNENLNSAIDRRLASGNPPSSFAAWPGPNLRQYRDQLMDVSEVWTANDLVDTIHSTIADLCRLDGGYRTVPIGSHRVNELFYNVTIVESAGVDPASLTDLPSFLDALERVAVETNAVPLAHGMQAPWTNLQLIVAVLLGQAGPAAYDRLVDGSGVRSPLVDALETTRAILTGYVNDDAATISFTEANEKILQGRAAFIAQGSWVYGMYSAADTFTLGPDWDWRPFPGTEGLYVANVDSFTFPTDNPTPKKKDVWARFVGQPDPQIAFSNRKGSVPVRTDLDSDRLAAYPRATWGHLTGSSTIVPTLTHGLAVRPRKLEAAKAVVGEHFMGPFDVEATADGLLVALSS